MATTSNKDTSGFQKKLGTLAKKWSTALTKDANKNLGKFKKLILVKSDSKVTSGRVDIITTASPKLADAEGNVKDVAKAYEYGSGTRSRSMKRSKFQMGARGFIRIRPKNGKVLAFPWNKVDSSTRAGRKFVGISEKSGKAMFLYVDHPGVRAANNGRGYMAPAITKIRKQMQKDIPLAIREEVIGSFRRAFKK